MGNIFVGLSLVASTYGKMLLPGRSWKHELAQFSIPVSDLYVDASISNDKVDWSLTYEH